VRRRDLTAEWTVQDSLAPRVAPKQRSGVHGVELDDESVLYDEHTDRLHLLNWSASAVWWAIDGRASVDELAGALAERFHAEAGVMRADVRKLLEVLGAQHLVDAVRPAGGTRG
jgi:hypothetical protein